MSTNYTPAGYRTVTPYLIVKGASRAMEYYARTLGAREIMRMAGPDGNIRHAEMKIGDSHIMLADEVPAMGFRSPEALGGSPVSVLVYVPDVDEVFARAIAGGAKEVCGLKDQFYGDRSGTIKDPFGHTWTIATHVEDVPPQEMERRAREFMKQSASQPVTAS